MNGEIKNLQYHNQRCNRSRKNLLEATNDIDLGDYISIPSYYQSGLVKCRISYDLEVKGVSFEHYNPRSIRSIKMVISDQVEYAYKYEDRSNLKMLFHSSQGHAEILIIKDDLVTDCFYYNVAFFDGVKWWTPEKPLLPGTMRAKLLDEQRIFEKEIRKSDIASFQKISLFNALNTFGSTELEINQLF